MNKKKWTYYNENDPFAAEWIRQLIRSGAISDGEVDEGSILDVSPSDVAGFKRVHWFAGIATWDYALNKAGWPDNLPVWTGSCPCQPFSEAGKGGGVDDERHLWPAMFWHIQQCRPPVVFGEQVASKAGLGWWDIVASDLEGAGYACTAFDLCAAGVGAPHIRQRLFWVAVSDSARRQWPRQAQPTGRQHKAVSIGGGQDLPLANPECSERRQISTGGDGQQYRKIEQRQATGRPTGGGATDALGNPGQSRLQGDGAGFLRSPQESSERNSPQRAGDIPFWHDAEWIPCFDGRARAIKPGTFPLADGVAPDLVCSSDHGLPNQAEIQTEATAEARVMRLKGYGNAIVAPLAVEFIRAVMSHEVE